jgi:hypothetical protein
MNAAGPVRRRMFFNMEAEYGAYYTKQKPLKAAALKVG